MRQIHIHTDLKWSSKEQSGLEMPRLGPGWPGHTLRGLQWPHVAPTGLSRGIWAIQRPVGASQGHSVSLRTTSGQYEYILVSFRNPVLFCKIRGARIKKLIKQKLTGAPKILGVDHFQDPVGHFEAPWWPFWIFEVLIEGMIESKNLFCKS